MFTVLFIGVLEHSNLTELVSLSEIISQGTRF